MRIQSFKRIIKSIIILPIPICFDGPSDHKFLTFDVAIAKSRSGKVRKVIKNYRAADFMSMNRELSLYFNEYACGFHDRTVEENWVLFREKLQSLGDRYIPTLAVSSSPPAPWFNNNLKRLRSKKKRSFRRAKRTNSSEAWQRYYSVESQFLSALKSAKCTFYQETLPSLMKSNPQRFWKIINPNASSEIHLTDSSSTAVQSNQCADMLNSYFTSVFTSEDMTNIPPSTLSDLPQMPPFRISQEGIVKLVDNCKLSSACGIDGINSKVLKNTKLESAKFLTLIFRQSLESGVIPGDWLVGKIIPVHKGGERHNPTNYRPISLTSVACKLLEHIIVKNIIIFLEANNFFYVYQHGFRKGLSCETQLAGLTYDITSSLDTGSQVDAVFLDFAKAFDRVPHHRLFLKLSQLNLDPLVLSWIRNFLSCRTQFVSANGTSSSELPVSSGIPQGSVIGPLLFLIFINDLPSGLLSRVRLFADDCVVYRAISHISDQEALQDDLDKISQWCATWQLPINIDKSKVISFSRVNTMNCSYYLGLCELQRVFSYKYLGVYLSHDMSWAIHISNLISSANRSLGFVRRNLRHCPIAVKKLAYTSLIRPKLEYASPIWDPHQITYSNALEAVQNRAVRFIFNNFSSSSSISLMKAQLSFPALETRRTVAALSLFHCIYHNSSISSGMLARASFVSPRVDHLYKVHLIRCRHDYFLHSFVPRAARLWNSLPPFLVALHIPHEFKNALACYLTS